ncbi:hypothetical protein [Limnochorda pilosa]|uniref:Uncharacterized protein n=1 Tax=Limnochorda pilosa TaxID=1555112 RepID=A0A0K2SJW3_LIMPI|nr:hypothetical protein [Limnochorda pilosa]BAS27385.1 hypothetical protein LIP_1538 [Limnochorda pilosa]
MKTFETIDAAPAETEAGEMEARFFQLLETDREAGEFLARFWELDRMLEAAMAAEGVRAAEQDAAARTVNQE